MEELVKERRNSTLNVEQLTNMLYGGEQSVKRKRDIELSIARDPMYDNSEFHFLHGEEKFDEAVKKSVYTVKTKVPALGITKLSEQRLLIEEAVGYPAPLDIYDHFFVNTVLGQGTKEQIAKWVPLARNGEILTCYAQTELGHGTFVQGLETTATYDPLREEFVLNTPTLTSCKWWSGSQGIVATHAVLAARLITKEEDRGIHFFITQLRRMDNHQPLPGVTVGDIGPKFGVETKDNGFLKLQHIHIPRENMLMKIARVEADGTYSRRMSSKLAYGSMVQGRTLLVHRCFLMLSRGVTIAIRYSAVRRQTRNKAGEAETQLLDYTNQQYVLLPLLAAAYALHFVSQRVGALLESTQSQLERENLELLPELHASSSGLKAAASKLSSQGIEACRIACGGQGYSQASGFPYLYSNTVTIVTAEGDYHILLLQTARYLVKMWKQVRDNSTYSPPDNFSYLASIPGADTGLRSSERQLRLYAVMARASVERAAARLEAEGRRGRDPFQAWNAAGVELIQCAEAHTYYVMVKSFIESLVLAEVRAMSAGNQRILKTLCDIFSLHQLVERAGPFLESGAVESSDLGEARHLLVSLLREIRPEAVCLVDAFDVPDFVLRSALGRKDGDVYRALWEWVERNPRNKDQDGVHPVYAKYLRQLLNSKL